MHMMMPVEALGVRPIEPPELLELRRDNVLEGADEPRVNHGPGEAMPQQVSGELPMAISQTYGTPRNRKWRGPVEEQARLDLPHQRDGRAHPRILHQDQRTYRPDRSPYNTTQR